MAIINNSGILISFDCENLISEVKQDIIEFGADSAVYAVCETQQGVKIVTDYIYDITNKEEMAVAKPLIKPDEWIEKTTFNKLLNYLIRLDNPIDTEVGSGEL